MSDITLYILVALGSLAGAGLLLFLLARFLVWLDWMELPAAERRALRQIERMAAQPGGKDRAQMAKEAKP